MPASESRGRRRSAQKAPASLPGSGTRTAFAIASATLVILNASVVVLMPLWPRTEDIPVKKDCIPVSTTREVDVQPVLVDKPAIAVAPSPPALRNLAPPAPAPMPSVFLGSSLPVSEQAEEPEEDILEAVAGPGSVMAWEDMHSPLQPLNPSALRLLPDARGEATARQNPCWLTFGLSSIHRSKAEYLGLTLSHLFDALGSNADTTIVVHLADFDETWVTKTAKWLAHGFADEVAAWRLHAIHAPQHLYPLKVVKIKNLQLGGFSSPRLNELFSKREGKNINGRETYFSTSGSHFFYWCQGRQVGALRRRWLIAEAHDLLQVESGKCPACARAPKDRDAVDPHVRGWQEFVLGQWTTVPDAGVLSIDLEPGESLKYGDSPERQRWRSKQNLDYAFLMWYAAGLSEYYMQLEDDIQVVPNFFPTVRSYIENRILGRPWILIAFSKLGFIGKFLRSSALRELGQFLFVFNDEAPCDWLVWIWIDVNSPEAVSPEIIADLEKEYDIRQACKQNLGMKRPKSMRDDVALLYRTNTQDQFRSKPVPLQMVKPLQDAKKKCILKERQDLDGTAFQVNVANDQKACMERCEMTANCAGFAFDSTRANTCWLKQAPLGEPVLNRPSVVSGTCSVVSTVAVPPSANPAAKV